MFQDENSLLAELTRVGRISSGRQYGWPRESIDLTNGQIWLVSEGFNPPPPPIPLTISEALKTVNTWAEDRQREIEEEEERLNKYRFRVI